MRLVRHKKFFLLALAVTAAVLAVVIVVVNWLGQPREVLLPPPDQVGEVYDLIVVGSDPEGVAAAVSGARNGLSVLLVDTRPRLGGLMTRGWLNSIDMNYGPDGKILNQGLFREFYKLVEGDSFDVNSAVWAFNRLVLAEKNLTVALGARDIKPVLAPGQEPAPTRVLGVELVWQGEQKQIRCQGVIDATQDGDLAALAGVPFTLGQEDIGRHGSQMAATLVFKLENVSAAQWLEIRRHLQREENKNTGANRHSAWGFSDITARYQPQHQRLLLRGLNLGRQNDGSILVNALLIFGVDPLDPDSRREARALASQELPAVVEFLRQRVPGLDTARLGGVAPELYIRESRHMLGEYRLTLDDVLENRDFPDRIAFGSYPVDVQPAGPGLPGVVIGTPVQYAVPFRCLVPLKVDGLLVVGRAASFDSLAHGSARTIPVGMATGMAAGAAAAVARENGVTYRQLARNPELVGALQRRLMTQGVNLAPFTVENPLANHWAYEGLKFVRGLGLVAGGYDNNYRLDEPIAEQRLINMLAQMAKQGLWQTETTPVLYPEENIFNLYDACYMIALYQGQNLGKMEAWEYLHQQGLFDQHREQWQHYTDPAQPLTHGAAYALLKAAVQG